jgi:N-formylglutamate deformylase
MRSSFLQHPVVQRFEAAEVDAATFDHRAHLEVAWHYLSSLTLEDALARYVCHLQALVAKLGVAQKFHRTLTWFWMTMLDQAMQQSVGLAFDALLLQHPHLLDRDLPLRWYSSAQLSSQRARQGFVLPERM